MSTDTTSPAAPLGARQTKSTPGRGASDATRHARKTVAMGDLGGLIGFRIRLAQIAIFSDVHTELDALALTPASFSVLEILFHNRGLTQTRLAHAVRLDRSSLVPLLDRLERRGLIRREVSTTDRRHNHLFLSAKGAALRGTALKRVREHDARVSARLSPSERRSLMRLLGKLA